MMDNYLKYLLKMQKTKVFKYKANQEAYEFGVDVAIQEYLRK